MPDLGCMFCSPTGNRVDLDAGYICLNLAPCRSFHVLVWMISCSCGILSSESSPKIDMQKSWMEMSWFYKSVLWAIWYIFIKLMALPFIAPDNRWCRVLCVVALRCFFYFVLIQVWKEMRLRWCQNWCLKILMLFHGSKGVPTKQMICLFNHLWGVHIHRIIM